MKNKSLLDYEKRLLLLKTSLAWTFMILELSFWLANS